MTNQEFHEEIEKILDNAGLALKQHTKAYVAIMRAIKNHIDEVIGEDEDTSKPYEDGGADLAYARNKLRAELRNKAGGY